jgi:hypothetical protein
MMFPLNILDNLPTKFLKAAVAALKTSKTAKISQTVKVYHVIAAKAPISLK